jgi:hypothetical protein
LALALVGGAVETSWRAWVWLAAILLDVLVARTSMGVALAAAGSRTL